MRFGVLGLIKSDLTDVNYELARWAAELGFHGIGAHITVPARAIGEGAVSSARAAIDAAGIDFLQLWGPYPSIITEDEEARRLGVEEAREIVRLAARLGVPAAGVRPTSHNPRGDWWPHPQNHTPETEDRLVRSISEILETAVEHDVGIVLETHVTSTLDSPQRIKRVIDATDPERVTVNIDPVNFVKDLETAFDPAPMVNELFDVLGEHCATVHVKDYYLEDRFVLHISETVPGTGMMDLDTVLSRTHALGADSYAIIEHLPVSQIPLAKRNLSERVEALGIEVA